MRRPRRGRAAPRGGAREGRMNTASATSSAAAPTEIVRVYVWEAPVRITHWLIACAIAVLSVTGFYIGNPFITVSGPAGQHFVMGWMKVIHAWAAWGFIRSDEHTSELQ